MKITNEIILTFSLLADLNLTNQNRAIAEKHINNKQTLLQIKEIIEDENLIKELIKALEEKGMKNPINFIKNQSKNILNNFNEIIKDEDEKLDFIFLTNIADL